MAHVERHCLMGSDFLRRLAALEEQINAAAVRLDEAREQQDGQEQESGARRIGESSSAVAALEEEIGHLAESYRAMYAEAEAEGLWVTQRGLSDEEWDEITDSHPPRKDNEDDARWGYSTSTDGNRALVMASMVEPEFASRTKFDQWVRDHDLTRGDMALLAGKAYGLTQGIFVAPKPPAALLVHGGEPT